MVAREGVMATLTPAGDSRRAGPGGRGAGRPGGGAPPPRPRESDAAGSEKREQGLKHDANKPKTD